MVTQRRTWFLSSTFAGLLFLSGILYLSYRTEMPGREWKPRPVDPSRGDSAPTPEVVGLEGAAARPRREAPPSRASASVVKDEPAEAEGDEPAILEGDVLDVAGIPVADAWIRIVASPLESPEDALERAAALRSLAAGGRQIGEPDTVLAATRTDAEGFFHEDVSALAPGTYRVLARAGDFGGASARWTRRAGTSFLELRLAPSEPISGWVTAPGGEPVANATVRAATAGVGEPSGAIGPTVRLTETDEGGRFVLEVPAGSYHLEARGAGFAPNVVARVASGTGDARIELRPERVITGTVLSEATMPLEGVEVTAIVGARRGLVLGGTLQGTALTPAAARACSGADGEFRLHGLPAGPVALRLAKPGFVPLTGEVPAGADRPDALPGEWVLREAAVVTGVVLDPEGEPVAGALVLSTPVDERQALLREQHDAMEAKWLAAGERERVARLRELRAALASRPPSLSQSACAVTTDESGRFRLDTLAPGRHRLSVEADGFVPAVLDDTGEIQRGEELEVEVGLDPGHRIAGTVRSVISDLPVAGALIVAAIKDRGERMTRSDGEGEFVLEGLPPDTGVRLRFEADGYTARVVERTTAQTSVEIRIDVSLEPPAVLAETVPDPQREPARAISW